MSLIKDSINQTINYEEGQNFDQADGQIIEWDDITELAKVKFFNPNSGGYEYVGGVRIMNTQGGVSGCGIKAGAKCTLNFTKGNYFSPVIVGIQDNYYGNRNNEDQGAYLPNDEVYKVGTPEHLVPATLDWIDETNDDPDKYNNELGDFSNQNVDEETFNMLTRLNHYDKDETGITNMETGATVRMRGNGDIDIFTKNNTGLRITAGGIIKMYCQDIEYTDNAGELDDTDRSLVTRVKSYQVTSVIEANKDIDHIEDTIETIKRIQSMKHVVSVPKASQNIDSVLSAVLSEGKFNGLTTSAKANSGKLQPFNAKVDSYQNIKAEYMSIPIEKDEQIAAYGNEIKNYREIFDKVLEKLVDKCIEIENGFETPCTGYIEMIQPAEESDGKMSAGTGPVLMSIKNYELNIEVDKHDVERNVTVSCPTNTARAICDYENISSVDASSLSSSVGSDGSVTTTATSTSKSVVKDVRIENTPGTQDVNATYQDSQTDVTVKKEYYEYALSQWVTKEKEVHCEGNNVKFYFYPVIT